MNLEESLLRIKECSDSDLRDCLVIDVVTKQFSENLQTAFKIKGSWKKVCKTVCKMVENDWTEHNKIPIKENEKEVAKKLAEAINYGIKGNPIESIHLMSLFSMLTAIMLAIETLAISNYESMMMKFYIEDEEACLEAIAENKRGDRNRFEKCLTKSRNLIDKCLILMKCFWIIEKDPNYRDCRLNVEMTVLEDNLRMIKDAMYWPKEDLDKVMLKHYDHKTKEVVTLKMSESKLFEEQSKDLRVLNGQVWSFNGIRQDFGVHMDPSLRSWLVVTVIYLLIGGCFCQSPVLNKVNNSFNIIEYRISKDYITSYMTPVSNLYREYSSTAYLFNGNGMKEVDWNDTSYKFPSICDGMNTVTKILDINGKLVYIERGCPDGFQLNYNCESCKEGLSKSFYYMDDWLCNNKDLDEIAKLEKTNLSKLGRFKYTANYLPSDFKICSVDGKILRPCKDENVVLTRFVRSLNFDGSITYYTDAGYVAWYEVDSQNSYTCMRDGMPCESTSYNGDETYCYFFECNTWSNCYCKPNMTSGIVLLEMMDENLSFAPKCLSLSLGYVGIEDVNKEIAPAIELKEQKLLTTPTYKQNKCQVDFEFFGRELGILEFRMEPYVDILSLFQSTGSGVKDKYVYSVKKEYCMNDKDVKADLRFLNADIEDSEYVFEFRWKGVTYCDVIECYWCYDYWFFMNCWSGLGWIRNLLMVMVVVIIVGYFFKTAGWLSYMVASIFKLIWNVVSWLFRMLMKMNRKLMKEPKDENENSRIVRLEMNVRREDDSIVEQTRTKKQKKGKFLSYLTLVMLINGIGCCSEISTLNAVVNSCTEDSDGIVKCTFSNQININISPYGQQTCLLMKDKDNRILGTLKMETEDVGLSCNYALDYYVPTAEHACQSAHSCDGNSHCTGDKCSGATAATYDSLFPNARESLNWPSCNGVCGCAGCGCFLCGGACLFSVKYFKNPSQNWYEVGNCYSWNYEIKIGYWIEFINKTGDLEIGKRLTATLTTASTQLNLNGKTGLLKLTQVSVPPNSFTSLSVIRDLSKGKSAMAKANQKDEFTIGRVGEIQCPDPASAKIVKNTCTGEQSLISLTVSGSHSVSCTASLVDVESVFNKNQLPISAPDITIYEKSGSIYTSIKVVSMYTASLTVAGLELSSLIDDNKCNIKFESLDGCYNCINGAVLKVTSFTDFGTASAHMTCSVAKIDTWFTLNTTSTTLPILVKANIAHVDEICSIDCGKNNYKVRVYGDLISVTDPNELVTTDKEGENFFIKLKKTPWGILLIVLACVLALGGILIVIWALLKCFKTKVQVKVSKSE